MHKWPPAVINHMVWRQRELEEMLRCDMYQHVARCHLDLAQLWWCPVSWCTVWKGAPQDLTDHIRGAHNVPGEIRNVRLEKFFPPWTVTRQVYTDSLTPRHSGISNDVLLFSDIGLSLVLHYRVYKRGLPHIVGTTCRSCALYYRCLRSCRSRESRPMLPARLCHVRLNLLTLCVPRLDCPDARSGAGGPSGSWSRLYGMFLYSRCRTRWLRQGRWCSIVVPRYCRCRWTLVVWTCRRFGLRLCPPRLATFLLNVSSHSGGGGGFA